MPVFLQKPFGLRQSYELSEVAFRERLGEPLGKGPANGLRGVFPVQLHQQERFLFSKRVVAAGARVLDDIPTALADGPDYQLRPTGREEAGGTGHGTHS